MWTLTPALRCRSSPMAWQAWHGRASDDSPTQLPDMPNSSASWRFQALGNKALDSAEEGCRDGTSSSALSRGCRARAARNCSARATMSCACPISACGPGMSPPQNPGPAPEQLPRAAAMAGVEQAPPPGLGLLHRGSRQENHSEIAAEQEEHGLSVQRQFHGISCCADVGLACFGWTQSHCAEQQARCTLPLMYFVVFPHCCAMPS